MNLAKDCAALAMLVLRIQTFSVNNCVRVTSRCMKNGISAIQER